MISAKTVSALVLAAGIGSGIVGCGGSESASSSETAAASSSGANTATSPAPNVYDIALAWRETSAERDMLYRQGFNVARDRLDAALQAQKPGDKPLAVVTDIDDTVLDSNTYWTELIAAGKQSFDDAIWDKWVENNGPTATPGSVDFLGYAKSKGVEVFYVSSRDQGEDTQKFAVANLATVGLPFADDTHVTMLRDSSDKEPAQKAIEEKFTVPVLLGDNLNDFKRVYYVKSVGERKGLAEQDAAEFGRRFVLFPNPTDGHWMRAVFGDSEPADTPEYRTKLRDAATGK
jgi:5'-nucleotidase (lipoprotein e(P4) family)